MIHRPICVRSGICIAVESLLERGKLPGWREIDQALRGDPERVQPLAYHLYPDLRPAAPAGDSSQERGTRA